MRTLMAMLATTASMIGTSSAFAQTAGAPDATAEQGNPGNTGIEDIVVTAQKGRGPEAAQSVPIALTAFSGSMVQARNITSLTQLGYSMPNARLEQNGLTPGYANFAFRGVGFNSSTVSDEPTVVTVLDGMALGVAAGSILGTLDVEAIEALRGPQGVLFGKNATGGVVSIRSRRPTGEQDFRATLMGGSYGRYGGTLAFEPETGDSIISTRIAASYDHLGGYYKNLTIPGDRGGEYSTVTVRPIVKIKPTDNFDITLIGQYYYYSGDSAVITSISNNTNAQILYGVGDCPGKKPICNDQASHAVSKSAHIIAEMNWNVGPGTITSITAYRDYDLTSRRNDIDGTAAPVFTIDPVLFNQRQFSEELRFAGSAFADSLEYTVGAYYFDQHYDYAERRVIGIGPTRPLLFQTGKAQLDQQSFALFGQLRYHLTDTLSILAGGRYTHEKKTAGIVPIGIGACPDFNTCPFTFRGTHKSSNFGPKAGIEWKPTQDILAYASATRGFRAGGFNVRTPAPTVPRPYDDERVDALEIGAKTQWFDRRLRLNIAAFTNKFKGLQRVLSRAAPGGAGTETQIFNAASARISGAELEATVQPVEGFQINGSVGYLRAKYLSFDGLDLTGDGIPDPDLAKRLRLERAPKWTYSIGANYTAKLDDIRELRLGVQYSYQADTPANTLNQTILPPIRLLDADASLKLTDHLEVAVFGKNLTDRIYGELETPALPTFYLRNLSPPRTFGVELRVTY